MFRRVSPAARNILAGIIILGVPLLFVLALYIGNKESVVEMHEEGASEKSAEEIEGPPEVKNYRNIEEVIEDAEPIGLPSEEDKESAEKTAHNFIVEFHRVDAKNPLAYLEAAKPYMTKELYEDYKGIPKRGTLAAQKAEAVGVETMPADLEDERQVWAVYVSSEETAGNGTVEMVFDAYSVLLVKNGQGWLVDGVRSDE